MPPITCALAKAKLAKFVAELREAPTVEKTTTAIKAGFLSSPTTVLKALGGNAAWNAFNELALKPASVGVDYLLSVGRAAATGFKTSPTEFRTLASSLDADGLGVMLRGFRRGARITTDAAAASKDALKHGHVGRAIAAFVDELHTRLGAEQVGQVLEFDRVKYKSPVVQALVDGAFAVQEAADRPYFFLSFNSSLYAQAKLMAIKEGLTGGELKARAARYFERPTDEMLATASERAMWATFRDETWLSRKASVLKQAAARDAETVVDAKASPRDHAAQKAKRRAGAIGSYALETTIPFTGVPSSIVAKVGQLSPLGFLSLITATSQDVLARRIAQSGLGAALMAVGYELADKDVVTAAGPTAPKERSDWETRGRQAWSIKVGDYWLDARFLAPGFAPIFMGASMRKLRQEKPDATGAELAGNTAAQSLEFITEQTYLQSINRLIEAAKDPERHGAALVTSQIPTPTIVNRAAGAADEFRRAPESLSERAAARVGARATTPKAQGSFGDLPPRTPLERASELLSPGALRKSHEDTPVLQEMKRLNVAIGKPGRTVRLLGQPIAKTAAEARAILGEIGPELERRLGALIASEEYRALTDEDKALAIEDEVTAIRAEANDAFKDAKESQVRREVESRPAPRIPR